jgi:hypothetical protein
MILSQLTAPSVRGVELKQRGLHSEVQATYRRVSMRGLIDRNDSLKTVWNI